MLPKCPDRCNDSLCSPDQRTDTTFRDSARGRCAACQGNQDVIDWGCALEAAAREREPATVTTGAEKVLREPARSQLLRLLLLVVVVMMPSPRYYCQGLASVAYGYGYARGLKNLSCSSSILHCSSFITLSF